MMIKSKEMMSFTRLNKAVAVCKDSQPRLITIRIFKVTLKTLRVTIILKVRELLAIKIEHEIHNFIKLLIYDARSDFQGVSVGSGKNL